MYRAQLVIEALTKEPIIKREVTEEWLVSTEVVKLSTFPARDAKIEGQTQDLISHLGLLYPNLPPSNYKITYTVGYEVGSYPMIVISAVRNLTKYRLTGDLEALAAAKSEIQVLKIYHLEKERDREDA
jgi:hypothetical protein